MRGYVNIPGSVDCNCCKVCGARPIIVLIKDIGYVVKCPVDDSHYRTHAGLIDINDWNLHNINCINHQDEKLIFSFH